MATEEAPSGPLSERLVHKVWKWRAAAYEELEKLVKTLAEDDPKFNEYGKSSK
jgi:hypothetical protein